MNEPTRVEDDLHAWIDGQLPEERRRRFEQTLARDPALAARAAGIERQNRWLRMGLDPLLRELVPQQLVDAARGPATDAGDTRDAAVGAPVRAERPPRHPGADRTGRAGARLAVAWRRSPPWTRWAMAAQLGVVIALGTVVARLQEPVAAYRTLGSVGTLGRSDRIAVVFDPKITEVEMRRIVRVADARIVDGPTAADAYVLAVAPGQTATALAMFASQRSVLLAAPLGPVSKP